MSKIAQLNVAIYGNSHEKHESTVWQQANELATWVACNPPHRVIAAGANGVALAAASGVREVVGVPEPGQPTMIDVFTDFDDTKNYFNVESHGGTYFENLGHLIRLPEVWVFFPGHQGTTIQLLTLLHLVRKGKIKMDYRRIVLMCERGHRMDRLAKEFWMDLSEEQQVFSHRMPWHRAASLTVVQEEIHALSRMIYQHVLEVFRQRGRECTSAHDFKNSFLAFGQVDYSTASLVIDELVASGQIKFA